MRFIKTYFYGHYWVFRVGMLINPMGEEIICSASSSWDVTSLGALSDLQEEVVSFPSSERPFQFGCKLKEWCSSLLRDTPSLGRVRFLLHYRANSKKTNPGKLPGISSPTITSCSFHTRCNFFLERISTWLTQGLSSLLSLLQSRGSYFPGNVNFPKSLPWWAI